MVLVFLYCIYHQNHYFPLSFKWKWLLTKKASDSEISFKCVKVVTLKATPWGKRRHCRGSWRWIQCQWFDSLGTRAESGEEIICFRPVFHSNFTIILYSVFFSLYFQSHLHNGVGLVDRVMALPLQNGKSVREVGSQAQALVPGTGCYVSLCLCIFVLVYLCIYSIVCVPWTSYPQLAPTWSWSPTTSLYLCIFIFLSTCVPLNVYCFCLCLKLLVIKN